MTTFTYLPGPRPDGYDPNAGFGFSGNVGYWYVDFVAERLDFVDFWFSRTESGVRLHIGEIARFAGDVDITDQYIDFVGASLSGDSRLRGDISRVDMGSNIAGFDGDYFRIDTPAFSLDQINQALGDFRADPDDNMVLLQTITAGVTTILGQTPLDNHGGFADESMLRTVSFGDGRDIFYWQGGNHAEVAIDLGEGDDLLRLYTDRNAWIDLADGTGRIGKAIATMAGVETVFGGDGNDRIFGSHSGESVFGGWGDDRVLGRGGKDKVFGYDGSDLLSGGGGNDRLSGQSGNDRLDGGSGNDRLGGGGGHDTLAGGRGNDRLGGGKGQDTFVFEAGADRIVDFDRRADTLHVDDALWGGTVLTTAKVLKFATVIDGDTVFDFGGGNTLIVEDYTNIFGLETVLTVI